MRKTAFFLVTALFTLALKAQEPKNVILYIGDGFGLAPKVAARMAMGQGQDGKRYTMDPGFQVLNLDKLRYNASLTTHSLNSWITDSAPGATVYAAGEKGKIDNEVLSLDPANGQPLETILEHAKKQGYAVGVVTSTRVTHATPAAFTSHIWYRDLEDYIAAQQISSDSVQYAEIFNAATKSEMRYRYERDWTLPKPKRGVEVDVILGGGARHYLPRGGASPYATVKDSKGNAVINKATGKEVVFSGGRADGVDLVEIAKIRGFAFVNSRDALLNIDLNQFKPGGKEKLLGLFHGSHVSYQQDRLQQTQTGGDGLSWEPSLADMTRIAIEVLKRKGGSKGFFLMVEGGRIDHLEHANTGGVSVVHDQGRWEYEVDADRPTFVGDGDAGYGSKDNSARTNPGIYGSDYMIKEVLDFDYAIGEGRKLLASPGKTLLLSTSDHECGAFSVVGLHDEADAQKNGTKIRTYAGEITKTTPGANPLDGQIARGDGGVQGWYPDYISSDYQGRPYPNPSSPTARRIVVAYGSNPNTNGNGGLAGGSIGNHTPQDVMAYSDDNTGTHARLITGRGLLDNTALTPIMADFLGLPDFIVTQMIPATDERFKLNLAGNGKQATLTSVMSKFAITSVDVLALSGEPIMSLARDQYFPAGTQTYTYDLRKLPKGSYIFRIIADDKLVYKQVHKK